MIPYKEQEDAATAAGKYHRGIISATTGSGKSLIAALIINKLQVRTLIVVPSLYLKVQLTEAMKNWFGNAKVGPNKDIFIENVQALDVKGQLDYDCLIIDEFHHSASSSYRKLNKYAWSNIYYRFGLTATPWRNNVEEKLLLESVLSDVIYNIDYKTSVKNGFVVALEAYYIELPKVLTDAYSWAQVYSELVVRNENRNNVIAGLLQTLEASDAPTLCLVKEIAHGEALSLMSGIPFANGQDDASRDYIRQFNSGEIKALIGTVGVLGEGIDTRPAEFIIIAGLGKAKSAFMQNVGRGLRKYPGKESAKVIIFKDKSHKFTLRHFNEQKKILLEEFGIIPVKLDLRGA